MSLNGIQELLADLTDFNNLTSIPRIHSSLDSEFSDGHGSSGYEADSEGSNKTGSKVSDDQELLCLLDDGIFTGGIQTLPKETEGQGSMIVLEVMYNKSL